VLNNTDPRAVVARTEDFDSEIAGSLIVRPAVSLYFYRVDFNKTMRAAWSAVGHHDGRSHLPLDLHFLVTAWASNAHEELALLGRTMQIFESDPILSGPLLFPAGEWAPGDAVQIVMEEISTEAVMRTFDSLPVDYRLSVPYIARVIRIDGRTTRPARDVTAAISGLIPSVPST
jgi:hypothetical protein